MGGGCRREERNERREDEEKAGHGFKTWLGLACDLIAERKRGFVFLWAVDGLH
jgi:hypothetical protein